ncbi:Phytochrome-like protein cph1 [compost metagenome]
MGFDPQFKETIFVLFQRLHSKTDYPGTGIGLAICKKIVENHRGYILADSVPGKGSLFTVFLPD